MQSFSFQTIAPYYDILARLVFGNTIDAAQKAFLSLMPKGSSVLIIGGGSGRILNDLIQKMQPKHITYIEASSVMLRKAKKRFQQIEKNAKHQVNASFIYGTEEDIPLYSHYDVLMTFFLLDIYPTDEAKALADKLSNHLKPSGSWLFADFCIQGNTTYQQYWQSILLKIMYKFFSFTSNLHNQSLPDYQRIFDELQYFPVQRKFFCKKFIISIIYRKLLS